MGKQKIQTIHNKLVIRIGQETHGKCTGLQKHFIRAMHWWSDLIKNTSTHIRFHSLSLPPSNQRHWISSTNDYPFCSQHEHYLNVYICMLNESVFSNFWCTHVHNQLSEKLPIKPRIAMLAFSIAHRKWQKTKIILHHVANFYCTNLNQCLQNSHKTHSLKY